MNGKLWVVTGIIFAAAATALGAWGAHGLTGWLGSLNLEPVDYAKRIENWKTGALYQFYHSLAIILVGGFELMNRRKSRFWFNIAAVCLVVGILLFSGSLYLMTLFQLRLGMIVPIGGVAFLFGWLSFAVATLTADFGSPAQ